MAYAGYESMEFINLFPMWKVWSNIALIDKKVVCKQPKVSDALTTLSRLTYTIEELRAETLPDGVDPTHLETYLSNEDFNKIFKMSREEYYKLPQWKQSQTRQANNFF